MSTAQDLRTAAINRLDLSSVDFRIAHSFLHSYDFQWARLDDPTYFELNGTFLLIVAEALDYREPMSSITVLHGCLEHPDAGDAISALQHAIAQPAPAPWVMLDEGEVNAIIMQARIDWGNATARFPSEVEIAALAIQKAFIGKQENKPDSAPLSMSMFASKADFDAATQPAKPEPQITGCTEQGFMIDSASANELVACDYAASTLCSAVLRILDGERNGFESQNEPWATVRNRLLARLDAAESTTQRVIEPFNPEPMAGSGQAAWMDIAREYATSACFYRGIVVEIGEKFGEAAQICDDGTTSDGILLLKIPELVDAMKARLDAAELDSKLLDWLDRELACPLTLHDGRYLNLGDKGVRQVISEAMKGKL